jgi:hypothetical protein
MQNIKFLIRKKCNRLGLTRKFDELNICQIVNDFLKNNLKEVEAKAEKYDNGCLVIKTKNSVEANEIYFFEEEIRFFLKKKGYRVRKMRIVC